MLRLLSPLLLAALVALGAAVPAGASFSGSNGKVVFVGNNDQHLYLADPWSDDPSPKDLGSVKWNDPKSQVQAASHTPAWSPDGTMFAYTAPVPDSYGLEHSAVFVRDADGRNPRQVSTPFALKEDDCPGQCDNGHAAWDIEPTWTPEGKVAFVRTALTGDESQRVGERGSTIYTVNPNGSGLTKIVRVPASKDEKQLVQAIVWPAASNVPYLKLVTPGGFEIRKGSHTGPVIAASPVLQDLDASPDGELLGYTTLGLPSSQIHVVELDGTPVETIPVPFTEQPTFRFSPDGNGVLRQGCARDRDGVQHCGLKLHLLEDPEGDIQDDDPIETPYLDLPQAISQNGGIGQRGQFDVQGQDLPIIYLPGFLGSEIQCDGENTWMPTFPPLTMQPIRLSADGLTNQTCASAGPTGKPVDKFMLKADVYGHAEEWLKKMNPPGGHKVLGWDWRKRPQESIEVLDDTVDELIAQNELVQEQGAKRVSMVGHSYGGLLMKLYVTDPERAKKVARQLTVGSPFWGSTKPFFPLTFGIEAPGPAVLDLMIGNEDLKDSMRNFGGAYHLLADDNFGQWLRVDGKDLDQAGVKQFLESVGAQGHLIDEGWRTHREKLDGWYDNKGRIDVRAVVGVGLLTPRHVYVEQDKAEGDANVGIRFDDGDETVPAHSAWQGTPGGEKLGDPVNLQRRCGITHMDQTKDLAVQGAYAQFLLFGRTPRKLPTPDCKPEGKLIEVKRDVPIPPPLDAPEKSRRALAASGPLSLGDAAFADLADVYQLPGGTKVVTNDSKPVELTFDAQGDTFTVTDLSGSEQGEVRSYGPVTGQVVLAPKDGVVKVDGEVLDGEVVERPGDGGDRPGGGGGGDQPGGGEGRPAGAGGQAPAGGTPATQQGAGGGSTPAAKLTASVRAGTLKVSRKGAVTVRAKVSGPGSGTLVLTAKVRGRTVKLASAKVVARKAGEQRFTVKLTKAGRAAVKRKVQAVATLRLGAAKATAKVTVKR